MYQDVFSGDVGVVIMQRIEVHPDNPQPRALQQACSVLRDDGVVAFLTDTGYTLACEVGSHAGVQLIRRARALDDQHLFTVLCRDLRDMAEYAKVNNAHFRQIKSCVPGAYTFILPATKQVPKRLRHPQRKTIGLRVTGHPVAIGLLERLEAPLLSVSLFAADSESQHDWDDDPLEQCHPAITLLLDSGFPVFEPSTVVDLTSDIPEIVREGGGDVGPFE